MEQYLYIILALLVVNIAAIVTVAVITLNKDEEAGNTEKAAPKQKLDYENDVKFMLQMVEYFCTQARNTKLFPYSKSNADEKLITDEILSPIIQETAALVLKNLSDQYRKQMELYFTNVPEFVTIMVFNKLTQEAMELNSPVIRKLTRAV
jgi:hypothetical protein